MPHRHLQVGITVILFLLVTMILSCRLHWDHGSTQQMWVSRIQMTLTMLSGLSLDDVLTIMLKAESLKTNSTER